MTQKEIVVILLDRLIRERHPEMLRFAFHLTRNRTTAEEITQEAYRKALLNWRTYDRRFAFSSWCGAIIRNLHIDERRSKWAHMVSLDQPILCNGDGLVPMGQLLREPDAPVLELLERREEQKVAGQAYTALGSHHKAVVRLLAEDRLKYRQVARRLSLPIGTVRSRLHRARRNARSYYP